MGNCEVCIEIAPPPLSTDRLVEAVRENDIAEVRRLLQQGVGVNSPIDEDGHTVMDVLMVEHTEEALNMLSPRPATRHLDGDGLTEAFDQKHKQHREMFELLREHGGAVSYEPNALERPSDAKASSMCGGSKLGGSRNSMSSFKTIKPYRSPRRFKERGG
mmetsp:Transcript_126537/g.405064  ORF Transcript_126537/g.405064 Transcript_126537/m.405064 type:complete len:160 (-) Transcript_126537:207-686(-)